MANELFLSDFDSEKSCLTVRLCGEIDHHSAFSVRSEIDDIICLERPKTLVLDLSGVDFMDSSGLGLIMGRYALVSELSGNMIILNPTERVKKILSLAGIGRMISIEYRKKEVKQSEK